MGELCDLKYSPWMVGRCVRHDGTGRLSEICGLGGLGEQNSNVPQCNLGSHVHARCGTMHGAVLSRPYRLFHCSTVPTAQLRSTIHCKHTAAWKHSPALITQLCSPNITASIVCRLVVAVPSAQTDGIDLIIVDSPLLMFQSAEPMGEDAPAYGLSAPKPMLPVT